MCEEVTCHTGHRNGYKFLEALGHCARFVHLGMSGHFYWAVSGNETVCPGVPGQAFWVMVAGLCIC